MTLVELIIGLVIALIIVSAIYASYVYFFKEVEKGEKKTALQRDADVAAYWIELAMREASWAYLDGETDDSVVAENLIDGWQKRIYADSGTLIVSSDGNELEVLDSLSYIHFYPRLDRVEYELELAEGVNTFGLRSSMTFRNMRYRGLWDFSEGSGDIAFDDSAFNNNAAIYGASWTGGKVGSALAFDGTEDYLMVPDNDDLDSGRRVGFSAWVRANSFAAPHTIINRNTRDTSHGFFLFYIQGNKIRYSFSTPGSIVNTKSNNLSWQAGKWYEVVVQHDDVQRRVHFYRDGVKVGESSYTGAMTPVTSGDLFIGAYQGSDDLWSGALDEVKFADL